MLQKIKGDTVSYFIVFLCGFLTALPLVVDTLFLLPWFSLVPLFTIAGKKKSAYRHGLAFSMGYYLVVYHWFLYLYPLDFAGFDTIGSLLVIGVAWFGLSLLQGLGTAFVPVLYRSLTAKRHKLLAPFTAAALWCVMEWAQTLFWFGVPWARLAVTQYSQTALVQGASLFGSLGVSFLMVLVSGFLTLAFETYRETHSVRQPFALVAALLFAGNLIGGSLRLAIPTVKETFPVAAIQGNLASGDKWADDSVKTSLQLYSDLTREAVSESGAKLVVWPETVLTTALNRNSTVKQALCDLAVETGAYLAVGAFQAVTTDTATAQYNAIFLFQPDGQVQETVYQKRHLVPFGEYLPMPSFFTTVLPFLGEINMLDSSLSAGTSSNLFQTELGEIGGLVCFDSIYETLTLASVRDGADLIVLATNDSWYKDSAAVYQHNGHAVLRAIESGRYLVRAANTGISAILTPEGKIEASLPPLVTGYVTGEASCLSHRTPYSILGNWIVWLSVAYLLVLAFLKADDWIRLKRCPSASAPLQH